MEILGKEYTVKYGLRAMFLFEEISEKPFEVKSLFDEYLFMYCCIASVKDNPALEFDEFIDFCNDHPGVLTEFGEIMQNEIKKNEVLKKKTE